jgi:WD40 repeat protein
MILSDARDLLQQYGAVIVNRALHVYHSAEVFMAQCTLSEQYSSSKSALQSFKTARLRSPRPRQWDGHEVLLTGLDGAVSHMAFSHDDMHLAATLKDGNVCIWSLVTQSVVSRSVQTLNVLSASFMPRSAGLICRERHQIVIRDISPLDVLSVAFTSSEVATTCMASSPDALHLSVGLQDGRVLFWSTANLATFSTLHFHNTPISCISISTDSTSLASACSAGVIAVWNVHAVEDTPYTLHPQEDQDIKHISFSSDGSCILYLSCLNPGLISDISVHNAQDEDIWIAGEELEYVSGGSEDESNDISEDGGGRASETGEDDMIEGRWEDVTEDGIADDLETAPDKMRSYFWYFRRAQDQEERQDVIPSSHCLLYRDFCFFVRRDGLLSTSIVYLRSLDNRDGHDFQRLDAGKHISAIGTSSSAALLACSHPDAGVVQVFNIEHYWKTNQGSRIILATRIIHAIMSPDGSRFAYISEDANGARIHTHSTTGSRHWSVAVTNTYDRDDPIENMIQLLGLTNIGALKDLVVIRRCVQKMEIWGSNGLVQRLTDIDMAEKVMCPNDGQHLVLIREGYDDEHGQDMDIWHIPSSEIVASNLCHIDDPSHIGLGGSKLVYRRRPHIYFRDLADDVESELILSPRMAYPCFALSPRGDAVAVCQLNGDQWDIEIWNMHDTPVGIVKILPSCLNPLYDVRFMHDRINLCLTFDNGESHVTHHNVPMRAVKRLNMTPVEPIVFVNWNGWVTYTVPGRSELRKVCWIPRHLLPNDSATLTIRGSLVVIEGDDVERQNVIFDVLPAIEYLESLKK